MINLLSPKQKEELFLRERSRLFVILGIVLLLAVACLILVLVSVEIYIFGDYNSQKIILDQTKKQYQSANLSDFENIIRGYNTNLNLLNSFYSDGVYFTDALKTISSIQKPSDIYFNGLELDKTNTGSIRGTIAGHSVTRESLLAYKSNLEGKLKNVVFSQDSWVKPKDIDFSLTFEITR